MSSDNLAGSSYSEWKETCETLHMWTQIVGKIRLVAHALDQSFLARHALSDRAWLNDFAHLLSARALSKSISILSITFCASKRARRMQKNIRLAPKSVADFYREVMERCGELETCGRNQYHAKRSRPGDPIRTKTRRTPPTIPNTRTASGACSCRATASSRNFAPGSAASAARSIFFGAASIWP